MIRRFSLRLASVVALGILLSVLALPLVQVRAGAGETTVSPVIRITPPAPVFDDAKRLEELAARRKRVAEAIGPKGLLIMLSAEPRVYTNDVDYQFRQENNLYYLTNLNQKRATLVLMPGNAQLPEVQFLPEGESREYRQEQRFAATWTKESGFTIQSASPIFAQMRVRKSAMELQLMQHAIDISIEAHQRAQAFASQAKWEYEVDAQVAYTFKLRNADNWGYPDIVGCGPNATTLHYEESQGPGKSGELMLMDVGAE